MDIMYLLAVLTGLPSSNLMWDYAADVLQGGNSLFFIPSRDLNWMKDFFFFYVSGDPTPDTLKHSAIPLCKADVKI